LAGLKGKKQTILASLIGNFHSITRHRSLLFVRIAAGLAGRRAGHHRQPPLTFYPTATASIFYKINVKRLKSGKIMGLWRVNDELKTMGQLRFASLKIAASYFFGSF